MRLESLTGFDLRGSIPCSLSEEPEKPEIHRLLLFTPEQSNPVYISEEFTCRSTNCISLTEVSFKEHFCRRSFRISLQLWGLVDSWQVVERWSLDLRQAKPVSSNRSTAFQGLTIYADAGHLRLPFSDCADIETRISHSHANSLENGRTGTASSEDQSLILRWLPWSKLALNRSASNPSTSLSNTTTLSYPALVDLWTLQRSIDEAQAASVEMQEQADTALSSSSLLVSETVDLLRKRIKKIQRQTESLRLETLKRSNQATKNRYIQKSLDTSLDESVGSFNRHTQPSSSECSKADEQLFSLESSRLNLSKAKNLSSASSENLAGQIQFEQGRLASELLDVFPIELVGDKTFHFTICGLMLPSVFAINHYDATQIGAALGFVAQVVVCLSKYLDVPLPYPITVFGSQSYITDNITQIKHGSNRFPLWTRGVLLYRVEYGLYLLHKNIEQLMNSLNLAVADLKQTLANLKNLLLVLCSEYKHGHAN